MKQQEACRTCQDVSVLLKGHECARCFQITQKLAPVPDPMWTVAISLLVHRRHFDPSAKTRTTAATLPDQEFCFKVVKTTESVGTTVLTLCKATNIKIRDDKGGDGRILRQMVLCNNGFADTAFFTCNMPDPSLVLHIKQLNNIRVLFCEQAWIISRTEYSCKDDANRTIRLFLNCE